MVEGERICLRLKRRKLRTLSGGQLQKVGLIQALINQPRICILDEPFEGLDIAERLYFQRVIQRLSFHSIVIISTHLIEEITEGELLLLRSGMYLVMVGRKGWMWSGRNERRISSTGARW